MVAVSFRELSHIKVCDIFSTRLRVGIIIEVCQYLKKGVAVVQFEFAQMIHEDRLHKAQQYRLYKQGTASKPSFAIRLRLRLGNLLIAFGKWLKSHPACHLSEGYIQREEGGAIEML